MATWECAVAEAPKLTEECKTNQAHSHTYARVYNIHMQYMYMHNTYCVFTTRLNHYAAFKSWQLTITTNIYKKQNIAIIRAVNGNH